MAALWFRANRRRLGSGVPSAQGLEFASQFRRTSVAAVGVGGHRLGDDPVEPGIEARQHAARRLENAARQLTGQQLVEQHPHGEEVGAVVGRPLPVEGLGRDVIPCAHRHMAHRQGQVAVGGLVVEALGQAEVGDFDPAVPVEQDVGGFDVAMDDAMAVGVVERVEDLGDDGEGFLLRQPSTALLQVLVEVRPVDVLHHEENLPLLGPAEVVNRDDGGMVQPGHGAGLLLEAGRMVHSVPVPDEDLGQQLDGHVPVEAGLTSLVDRSHSAAPEKSGDFVLRQEALQLLRRRGIPKTGRDGPGPGRVRPAVSRTEGHPSQFAEPLISRVVCHVAPILVRSVRNFPPDLKKNPQGSVTAGGATHYWMYWDDTDTKPSTQTKMNVGLNRSVAILGLFSFAVSSLNAETRSFSDAELASGNPVVKDGFLIWTWPENGGSFSFITEGIHTGLWLAQSNTSGTYTLTFSEPVISVEIEFDALSADSWYPAESITDFSTSNGPAAIDFIPQGGAVFDSGTIVATAPDGQGIIQHRDGRTFTSFTFRHDQPSAANGFVIERIQVEFLNRTPIGNAQSVFGSPIVTRGGVSSALRSGDPIYSGDILETGVGGEVELVFIDETWLSIGEDARFEIDEYYYEHEPATGENRSRFSLLRGLFEYTSGLIGANDHDDVGFETPLGNLGIRGTEFSIEVAEDGPMTEVTLTVVSGAVAFENWWTGEVSEIAAGGSLQAEAPTPSQQTVSPPHRVVPAEGGERDFQVTSSGSLWSWSVTEGGDWVGSAHPANWPGNGIFHYSVAPNPDPAPRRAIITLTSGPFTATHTIHQAGAIPGDTTPPELVVNFPMADSTQTVSPVLIQADLSDNLGLMDFVEIAWNGGDPFLIELFSPGLTEKRLDWGWQPTLGNNTFVITAYDQAGNSTSVTRSLTFGFGTPPPALIRVQKPKPFPSTRIGRKSRSRTVRLTNVGGTQLTGLRATVTGRAKRDFRLVQSARRTLAPGTSTVFKTTFHPRTPGLRRAILVVRSNAPPVKVTLSGRGKSKI